MTKFRTERCACLRRDRDYEKRKMKVFIMSEDIGRSWKLLMEKENG